MSKTPIEWVKHLPPSARKEFFQLCKEEIKEVGPLKPVDKLSTAISRGFPWPTDNWKYWMALRDNAILQEIEPAFKGAYRWATILSH